MSQKSVVIIGAGIAGLSAGCYAQMNGFRTLILESHDKAGGLCTSWRRKGYTIESSLHWLVGTTPGERLSRIWEELGALEGKKIVHQEEFLRFEGKDGKIFSWYTDIDRLEQHMMEIAPQDASLIRELTGVVRMLTRFELPIEKAIEVQGLFEKLKIFTTELLPFLPTFMKWHAITIEEYAARFKNPMLREALSLFSVVTSDMPAAIMLLNLAWMHRKSSGYPVGGAFEFIGSIDRRYRSLGGEILYNTRADKILTDCGRAVGVRSTDGTEYRADYVISAADGYTTIFHMPDGKYIDKKVQGYYNRFPVYQPLAQVALGIADTFADIPQCVTGLFFLLAKPIEIAGWRCDRLGAHIYNFDPTAAPDGKSVLKVGFHADYLYWQRLKENPFQYQAEKEKIVYQVIDALSHRFPGIASRVEMADVATPATYYRYTGNWQASTQGWKVTPHTWKLGMTMRRTLPGLSNFLMAGHWVEPGGGLPPSAVSGRNAVQVICKQEKMKFLGK
jgi:phytoene dehydrogenase-like protein